MKWKNDPNKILKHEIYCLLVSYLPDTNRRISIKMIFDSIDLLIDNLTKDTEK